MSTHEVKVIRIDKIGPHGNADTLEVAHIWGYTSCVRIGDFRIGDLAAFLEPDTLVPADETIARIQAPIIECLDRIEAALRGGR